MGKPNPPLPDLLMFPEGEIPNGETIAAIEAALRGEGLYGPFATAEEVMQALHEPD